MTDGWQVPGSTPDDGRPAPSVPPAQPQQRPDLGKATQPAPPPGPAPVPPPVPLPVPVSAGWGGQQQHGYGYGAAAPPSAQQPPLAPRPGVVPLRPLSMGEIYDGAFQAMRRNPGAAIGSAAVIGAVMAVLTAVALVGISPALTTFADPATVGTAPESELLGSLGGLLAGYLGLIVVTVVGLGALLAMLVSPVSRAVMGQRTTLGEAWEAGRGRLLPAVGLVALAFVFFLVVALVGTVVVSLLAVVSPWFLLLLGLLLPALFVLYLWLIVRVSMTIPALVLERAGLVRAWRRGVDLVGTVGTGRFWRSAGILLLALVIVGVANGILSFPAFLVSGFIAFSNPDDPAATAGVAPVQVLVSSVFSVVATAVVFPFWAGVSTLLYVDHRMRQEGLDVELARAASQ